MDSMSEVMQYDSLADRIIQDSQVNKFPAIIVEGPDDEDVLRDHFHQDEARFFPSNGKKNALNAARQLIELQRSEYVYVVVDLDFDDPQEIADLREMVHPYEGRDLEDMLISLGVLDKVILKLGDRRKIVEHGGVAEVRKVILNSAQPLARLRSANRANNWGIDFDDIDRTRKIEKKNLSVNIPALCQQVRDKSDSIVPLEDLIRVASSQENIAPRGKDSAAIAGLALQRLVGARRTAETTEELLVAQLHLAAGLALRDSQWMKSLRSLLGLQGHPPTPDSVGA